MLKNTNRFFVFQDSSIPDVYGDICACVCDHQTAATYCHRQLQPIVNAARKDERYKDTKLHIDMILVKGKMYSVDQLTREQHVPRQPATNP